MKLKCLACGQKFMYAEISTIIAKDVATSEFHICPYCGTKDIDEYQEPQAEIISVKSVPLEEVDSYLGQGYVVHELYAKSATLVKREVM